MRPKVTETYQREGVYATIRGKAEYLVKPDFEAGSDQYILTGPNHYSIHRGYYEAVQEGIKLADYRNG